MSIDAVLLSAEFLLKIRSEVEAGAVALSEEQEMARYRYLLGHIAALERASAVTPIPMRLTCPSCGELHIDEGEFATKPHHTNACQHCGNVWRPAIVDTVGARFLPGFKNGGGS